jgi:serine protease Do
MKQRQSSRSISRGALSVIMTALIAGGAGFFASSATQAASTAATSSASPATVSTPTPKPNAQAVQDLKNQVPLDFSKLGAPLPANLWVELSKLVNPAVVSITTTQVTHRAAQGRYRDPLQDFFDQFYGGHGPNQGQMEEQPQQTAMALGTGFIIRDDGLIITNNHVVEQADVIKVQIDENSGKLYEAQVIGRDPRTDIALIKIDAKEKLPVAKLGESKNVQVGEYVAAFGNPYGHAHTMTTGIVSALGREIAEINRFPFIQTDASINPGNSGGPLVNTQGYVIGVNTAIDARAQGIGFAIPVDNVKQIVQQLEKDGRVHRGYVGVNIATVNADVAAQLGLPEARGILVTDVLRGGPADKAGIKPYDIITKFGDKDVNDSQGLQNAVGDTEIGSNAKVKIWRFDQAGKRSDVSMNIKVEDTPTEMSSGRATPKTYFGQKAPFDLGFKVANYSEQLAKDLGLRATDDLPIITDVDRGSFAAKAGLRPGDQIIDVNRRATAKATDVLRQLKKGANLIRISRGNSIAIVTLGK